MYVVISTHTPHARRDMILEFFVFLFDVISTHTPHARRDKPLRKRDFDRIISTHTPHARRDYVNPETLSGRKNFNSHASCEA